MHDPYILEIDILKKILGLLIDQIWYKYGTNYYSLTFICTNQILWILGIFYLLSILAFLHCTKFLHIINYAIINQIPVQLNRIKNKTNKQTQKTLLHVRCIRNKRWWGWFFPLCFSMSTQCKALKINTLIENNITSIHAQ